MRLSFAAGVTRRSLSGRVIGRDCLLAYWGGSAFEHVKGEEKGYICDRIELGALAGTNF